MDALRLMNRIFSCFSILSNNELLLQSIALYLIVLSSVIALFKGIVFWFDSYWNMETFLIISAGSRNVTLTERKTLTRGRCFFFTVHSWRYDTFLYDSSPGSLQIRASKNKKVTSSQKLSQQLVPAFSFKIFEKIQVISICRRQKYDLFYSKFSTNFQELSPSF